MTRKMIQATPLLNGSPLPDFALSDGDGHVHTPQELRGERGLVVGFIHGTWCPYCVNQLVRFNRTAPRLQELGVGLLCISHDAIAAIYAYSVSAQPPLLYPLLSDSEPSVAHAYGVFDPDHDSPYPAVFFAGPDGWVLYSDVSSDPDCFPNMQRLLEVVEAGHNRIV